MNKPDFFIVGAPKCGTTAMYQYLRAHPDIFMPETVKEPHFFAPNLAMVASKPYANRQRYLSLFADATHYKRVGEASVMYLFSATAAQAIYDFNPDARILIMLRSPIEVIYAWFYQQVKSGNETLATFEEALAAEVDRKQGNRIPLRAHPEKLHYRAVTHFAPQVKRYFDAFGRDAVHVIIFDDFKSDVAAVYRNTLEFLGVGLDFRPEFRVVNENEIVRFRQLNRLRQRPPPWLAHVRQNIACRVPAQWRDSINTHVASALLTSAPRPSMLPETRQHLQSEFLPEIEALSELLGRDLTHWCRD